MKNEDVFIVHLFDLWWTTTYLHVYIYMQCMFKMFNLWWTAGNEGLDENLGRRHSLHLLVIIIMMVMMI